MLTFDDVIMEHRITLSSVSLDGVLNYRADKRGVDTHTKTVRTLFYAFWRLICDVLESGTLGM